MANRDSLIMQHVLEVRLERHILPFIDFKGELTQHLLETYKGEKLKISDNRIDVLSPDEKIIYFIGTASFGFQMDLSSSFDQFNNQVDIFFKAIENFPKYSFGKIARVGTKTTIFRHRKGVGFDELKNTISGKYLKDIDGLIGNQSGNQVVDIAVPVNYTTPRGNLNINVAPIKKQQLLKQVLLREGIYQSLSGNGLIIIMDYFQTNIGNADSGELIKIIRENVNEMKLISQKIQKEM